MKKNKRTPPSQLRDYGFVPRFSAAVMGGVPRLPRRLAGESATADATSHQMAVNQMASLDVNWDERYGFWR